MRRRGEGGGAEVEERETFLEEAKAGGVKAE